MLPSSSQRKSPLVVSTAGMALDDLQKKKKDYDDLSMGMYMQGMKRNQSAQSSVPQPNTMTMKPPTVTLSYGQ
jgi:hypothetical protein